MARYHVLLILGLSAYYSHAASNRMTYCEYMDKIGVKDDRCTRKVRQIEEAEDGNGKPTKWTESADGPVKKFKPRFLIATIWKRVDNDNEGIQARLQRDRVMRQQNEAQHGGPWTPDTDNNGFSYRNGNNGDNNGMNLVFDNKIQDSQIFPPNNDDTVREVRRKKILFNNNNINDNIVNRETSVFDPLPTKPIFQRTDFDTKVAQRRIQNSDAQPEQPTNPDAIPNPTVQLTNQLNQFLHHENSLLKIKIFKLKRKQRRLRSKIRVLKWAVALLQKRVADQKAERKRRPKMLVAKSERLTTAVLAAPERPIVADSAHLEHYSSGFRRSRDSAERATRLQTMLLKVQSKKLFAYAVLRK
ncbi:unnamed protein product [Bursaphelenchus okinawaensis]|uniref:Uncharacterized protein n=1 Tax=Bursaphelenchus okinawaensis TaxID=465554 RepID=A0A811L7X0_9BILA|nr:unnamed protein product [Bursaphelenchus okinawaensis]CAG9118833.1 unnamed protein product [Bursaphelenchus okinawaensis]